MPATSLAQKLLIKPGQRIAVLNAPRGYLDQLGPLSEGVELAHGPEGRCDLVLREAGISRDDWEAA